MAQQGHSVTCYNRGGHHVSGSAFDAEAVSKYKGVRLKTVPTIDKKGLAAVTSSSFAALCGAFGPYDVVHILSWTIQSMMRLKQASRPTCSVICKRR